MALITLLTDYGYKDPYVAGLKAKILSCDQSLKYVDISHDVEKFHIQEASFILNSVFRDFPEGTVHLVGVESAVEPCDFLIVEAEKYLFVVPDNGILSMIVGFKATRVVKIAIDKNGTAIFKNNLIEVACGLAQGKDALDFGDEIAAMSKAFVSELKITSDELTGNVVYIDSYGNVVTDIPKTLVEATAVGRPFEIKVAREYIKGVNEDYKQNEASVVAVYNTNDYVEIAITEANASKLLGVRCGDLVQVLFKPKQSLL